MSLKYAILGFLTLEPMTGYSLKTEYFDRSVANFWPADQAQIYRTLYQLEDDGWVTSTEERQDARPNRKRYSITDTGEAALRTWLNECRPLPPERFPFLLQLYFCRLLERESLLALLQDQKRQHEKRLAQYQAVQLPTPDSEEMSRQLMFGGFTLDFGLRYEQMQIEWLEAVIARVREASID